MNLLSIYVAIIIGGLSDADVILVNDTGLSVARIEIDGFKIEAIGQYQKVLVSVTPKQHHLKVVFRGGADVNWPHFDFKGVHEIFFQRVQNKIEARFE